MISSIAISELIMFDCHPGSSIFSQVLAVLDPWPPSHRGAPVYSLVTKDLSSVSRVSLRLSLGGSRGVSLSATRFVLREIMTGSHEIVFIYFFLSLLLPINSLFLHSSFLFFSSIYTLSSVLVPFSTSSSWAYSWVLGSVSKPRSFVPS